MPRKSRAKQPDSPAGDPVALSEPLAVIAEKYGITTAAKLAKDQLAEYEAKPLARSHPDEYTQPGETPLQAPDYKLAKYDAPLEPLVKAQIKTARSFTGRIASGRGRTITADDSSFAIEADKPLTAGEIALAQRNGFDDFSEKSDGRIMVADKAEMRRANGDINHVARALTSKDAGRER